VKELLFFLNLPMNILIELARLFRETLSGANGVYSSKKSQMFWCMMLGSALVIFSQFTKYKADPVYVKLLFGMAGLMPAMGIFDKKINDQVPLANSEKEAKTE
jgi:hypothetical protein